jgi:hypothetical protein
MPRVGTGTCDRSFQIKNHKDKEQSFIFPIKKNECSTGKFNIFKKFQRETP